MDHSPKTKLATLLQPRRTRTIWAALKVVVFSFFAVGCNMFSDGLNVSLNKSTKVATSTTYNISAQDLNSFPLKFKISADVSPSSSANAAAVSLSSSDITVTGDSPKTLALTDGETSNTWILSIVPSKFKATIKIAVKDYTSSDFNFDIDSSQNYSISVSNLSDGLTLSDKQFTISGLAAPFSLTADLTIKNTGTQSLPLPTFKHISSISSSETTSTCAQTLEADKTCVFKVRISSASIAEISTYFTIDSDQTTLATYKIDSNATVQPELWLDPSNSDSLYTDSSCTTKATASGQKVACFKNQGKTASKDFIQSNASLQPSTYSSIGFAGKRTLKFTPNNTMLPASADVRTSLGPASAFVVIHREATSSNVAWQRVFSSCLWSDAVNDINAPCFAVVAFWDGNGSPPPLDRYFQEIRRTGNSVYLKSVSLGYNIRWSSEHFEGEIGELVLHGSSLTDKQVSAIRAYYAARWKYANEYLWSAN